MLTKDQRMQFRKLAHNLNPVVIIGAKELTPAVHKEIDAALDIHELIKIRVNAKDKAHFQSMVATIIEKNEAELIHTIGHVMVIYRQSPERGK